MPRNGCFLHKLALKAVRPSITTPLLLPEATPQRLLPLTATKFKGLLSRGDLSHLRIQLAS